MFCPHCKIQWADFPKEDFNFNLKTGFKAIKEGAVDRRNIVFLNPEEVRCPDCKEVESGVPLKV